MSDNALPPITLSSRDLLRLEQLLESPALGQTPTGIALADEISRANVLEPDQVPADLVTMNSEVTCVDDVGGEVHQLTLVYPRDSDADAGKVSVLAPVGSALLGLSLGQSIDWAAPGGRRLRLRVTAVRHPADAPGDAG